MNKSPDAYRTISEVAEDLDLPQHVLRFWETRFSQIKPLKRAGGRRFYRPDDVDLLKGIRHFLYKEGYTIKGVQRILKDQGIKAVITLVRETGLEPLEVSNSSEQSFQPTIPAMSMVREETLIEVSPPFLQPLSEPLLAQRVAPPPLETPQSSHKDDTVLNENLEVLHAKSQTLAPIEELTPIEELEYNHAPQKRPLQPEWSLFATLPPTSLSQNAPLPPPTSSKVSMFRGGITAQNRENPAPALPRPAPSIPVSEPDLSSAPILSAPIIAASPSGVRTQEAHAVLVTALQELATCRDLVEAMRHVQQAAE